MTEPAAPGYHAADREPVPMVQTRNRWVEAEAMVRSRAWREGYASLRRGEDADFTERGSKALAYEYGRLTAAWLKATDRPLPWISERRPLPERFVPLMTAALLGYIDDATG